MIATKANVRLLSSLHQFRAGSRNVSFNGGLGHGMGVADWP
jgi:hypothetical protein